MFSSNKRHKNPKQICHRSSVVFRVDKDTKRIKWIVWKDKPMSTLISFVHLLSACNSRPMFVGREVKKQQTRTVLENWYHIHYQLRIRQLKVSELGRNKQKSAMERKTFPQHFLLFPNKYFELTFNKSGPSTPCAIACRTSSVLLRASDAVWPFYSLFIPAPKILTTEFLRKKDQMMPFIGQKFTLFD